MVAACLHFASDAAKSEIIGRLSNVTSGIYTETDVLELVRIKLVPGCFF